MHPTAIYVAKLINASRAAGDRKLEYGKPLDAIPRNAVHPDESK